MTPKQKRRLAFAAALVAAGGVAAWAVVGALKDNVLYFRSPSDAASRSIAPGTAFRLGGLVEKGSVTRGPGAQVHFSVTDGKGQVPVAFNGVLPALFREGQGTRDPGRAGFGRHLPGHRSSGQARREIHAAGSGGIAQAQRTLEGRPE